MRSQITHNILDENIGKRVGKLDNDGTTVLGVVVGYNKLPKRLFWRVEYDDGTEDKIPSDLIQNMIATAEKSQYSSDVDSDSLIVSGKRRRTVVDYRVLNEQLFKNIPEEEDNDYKPKMQSNLVTNEIPPKGLPRNSSANGKRKHTKKLNVNMNEISSHIENTSKVPPNSTRTRRRNRTPVNYKLLHNGEPLVDDEKYHFTNNEVKSHVNSKKVQEDYSKQNQSKRAARTGVNTKMTKQRRKNT